MSKYICKVCNKEIEGNVINRNDLSTRGEKGVAIRDQVLHLMLGMQCSNCQSWICSNDLIEKRNKLGGFKGYFCPICDYNIGNKYLSGTNTNIIYPENIPTSLEEKMKQDLELDERLIYYCSDNRGGYGPEFELAITNKRVLVGHLPMKSISITDIATVGMGWSKHDGLLVVIEFKDKRPLEVFQPREHASYGSFEWRQTVEADPREICKAAHLPFAAPTLIPIDTIKTKKTEGIYVQFWPKSDLKWPDFCPDCMEPLSQSNTRLDNMYLSFSGETRTSLTNIKTLKPSANINLEIPYCDQSYKKGFFGNWVLKRRAIEKFYFDGIDVVLYFSNTEYAEKFVELNSQPL